MSDDTARAARRDDHTDLAVAWVLHTLDADREAEFLAHLELEGCDECAVAVAEAATTLETVALAVPQEDPPPSLRGRLLAAAEAERPGAGSAPDTASDAGEAAHDELAARRNGVVGPSAPSAPSAPASGRPRRRRVATRLVAVAAAAAAVVAIGGLVAANQSLRSERDAQAAAVAQYGRIVEVMRDAGAPGSVSAPLSDPAGALVGIVVDQGAGPEVLTTALDANRSDETYVLWALAGPAPTPLGTFDVPGGGASVRSVPSTAAADPVAGYAVSLEPGRTAPAAPTRIVASGQVGR